MDTYSMSMAMSAVNMANQSASLYGTDTQTADVSFAQILGGLNGQQETGALGQMLGLSSEMNWQDVQMGMMFDALKTIQDAEQPTVTDPALAELIQLLQNMGAKSGAGLGEEETADMLKVIEQIQQRLGKILEEEGATVAGQQAMALMSMMPQMTDFVQNMAAGGVSDTGANVMLQMALTSTPEELLNTMLSQTDPSVQQAATSQTDVLFQDVAAQADGEAAVATESAPVQAQARPAEVLPESASGPSQAQTGFAGAVQAVKEKMATADSTLQSDAGTGKTEELDVDELQRQVDAGEYMQNTTFAQTVRDIQTTAETVTTGRPAPVADQMQEAIQTGLQRGDEEIVVKLNPEELGEVTVRMQKTDEGMKLSIIAKEPETQRLLAAEMNQLQENLKPMKAEVDAIITQRQYELLAQQEQFGGQHQRSWKEMHGAAYYKDEPLGAVEETVAVAQTVSVPNTVLDARI